MANTTPNITNSVGIGIRIQARARPASTSMAATPSTLSTALCIPAGLLSSRRGAAARVDSVNGHLTRSRTSSFSIRATAEVEPAGTSSSGRLTKGFSELDTFSLSIEVKF